MKVKKCIICETKFTIKIGKGKHAIKSKGVKKRGTLNCSPNCSRIYRRITMQIRGNKRTKPKNEDQSK